MADTVTTWPPVFESNPKMPRLDREVTITEKIDGSSLAVWVPEDSALPLVYGSRNRFITPGKATDNFGFAAWATANEGALRRLGPGCHRGEWFGCGIARNYGLAERRWALFNTGQWNAELLKELALPANITVVPVLHVGDMLQPIQYFDGECPTPAWDAAVSLLAREGSKAVPGFMQPEGIVLWHKAAGRLFKWTFDGDGREGSQKTPSPVEHP